MTEDVDLVRRIAEGDTGALQAFYARHGGPVLNYLMGQLGHRQQAEEVLQDVMLAVWKGAARFEGRSTPRTWLLAIARHHAINARTRRPPAAAALPDPEHLANPGPDPLDRLVQRQDLDAALARLPADQRETLELVFYHGLSGPEVAEIQGVATGTVKSRLHRAKHSLRQYLSESEEA